jgi:hypothetical protein
LWNKNDHFLDEIVNLKNRHLLQLVGDMVAGRQPVVVRLELGGHHAEAEVLAAAQTVQVEIADLKNERFFSQKFSNNFLRPTLTE